MKISRRQVKNLMLKVLNEDAQIAQDVSEPRKLSRRSLRNIIKEQTEDTPPQPPGSLKGGDSDDPKIGKSRSPFSPVSGHQDLSKYSVLEIVKQSDARVDTSLKSELEEIKTSSKDWLMDGMIGGPKLFTDMTVEEAIRLSSNLNAFMNNVKQGLGDLKTLQAKKKAQEE